MSSMSWREVCRIAVLLFVSSLIVIPIVATVLGGFKSAGELRTEPFGWPDVWHFEFYGEILTDPQFWRYLGNSLWISLLTVFLTLILGSMAAYTFAQVRFFGSNFLFTYMLLGLMFPFAAAIMPLFLTVRNLGLLDTSWGVVLPQVAFGMAFSILFFRTFFEEMPKELFEAARIDGCGYIGFFFRFTLPLSTPILATIAVFVFVQSWNNYLLPLIMLNDRAGYTWTLGAMDYRGEYIQDWNRTLAFISVTLAPAVVFFYCRSEVHRCRTNRRLSKGVDMTDQRSTITNPILKGFNPDPSILRVEDDYYIATSTFEWYPGVQIHHSRDLVNWRLITRPLNRKSQLDMRGNPDSGGVWAPCLTHADGLFWLVYTDVKRLDNNYKDTHNYLVTAPTIEGAWSDPVYLNSSGFDPSLFHDDDGRKWLVNLVWDHRGEPSPFGGILLQEYDHKAARLIGPVKNVFKGSELGCTEGPHLYKRGDFYYMVTAEGGTGYRHAVTLARSKTLDGPYELHPDRHVVTAKDDPDSPLQRAGHGDIVETPSGDVYVVSLASRPLAGMRKSPLGRETVIERAIWGADGWLRLEGGSPTPRLKVSTPVDSIATRDAGAKDYSFDEPELPIDFQWLRTPERDRIFSLTERPGYLRLFGREAIGSWFEQALVARRATDFSYVASTIMEFEPTSFQQCAGLVVYYNRHKFHYLNVTFDEDLGRILSLQSCAGDWPENRLSFGLDKALPLPESGPVYLQVKVEDERLQFFYAAGEAPPAAVGPVLDAAELSDEGGRGEHASFTGTFVGMACHDLTGLAQPADFTSFRYDGV